MRDQPYWLKELDLYTKLNTNTSLLWSGDSPLCTGWSGDMPLCTGWSGDFSVWVKWRECLVACGQNPLACAKWFWEWECNELGIERDYQWQQCHCDFFVPLISGCNYSVVVVLPNWWLCTTSGTNLHCFLNSNSHSLLLFASFYADLIDLACSQAFTHAP